MSSSWKYGLREGSGCQAVTKPDHFPKQSGHSGVEFDMSDNLLVPSQYSAFSEEVSHGHLGLCYKLLSYTGLMTRTV